MAGRFTARRKERQDMLTTEWLQNWVPEDGNIFVERWISPDPRDRQLLREGHFRIQERISAEEAFVINGKTRIRDLPPKEFGVVMDELKSKLGVGGTSEVVVRLPGAIFHKGKNGWVLEQEVEI